MRDASQRGRAPEDGSRPRLGSTPRHPPCASRRSARASRTIDHDDCRNSAAITTATARSGHGVPVQATSPAAATTARFPSASFRAPTQGAQSAHERGGSGGSRHERVASGRVQARILRADARCLGAHRTETGGRDPGGHRGIQAVPPRGADLSKRICVAPPLAARRPGALTIPRPTGAGGCLGAGGSAPVQGVPSCAHAQVNGASGRRRTRRDRSPTAVLLRQQRRERATGSSSGRRSASAHSPCRCSSRLAAPRSSRSTRHSPSLRHCGLNSSAG